MKIARLFLFFAFAVFFGVLRAQKDSVVGWDETATMLLAGLITAWVALTLVLLRFIDARNRTRRLIAFAGFLVLLGGIFSVGWFAFDLKREFLSAPDFATSLQTDLSWLILFPLLFHYGSTRKNTGRPMPAAPESVARGTTT